MSVFTKFVAPMALALGVVSLPFTADALSVRFLDVSGTPAVIDEVVDGDIDDLDTSADRVIAIFDTTTLDISTVNNFPAADELISSFQFTGPISNRQLQVTHNFDNDLPPGTLGRASVSNNFLNGGTVTTETFIGTSAYDTSGSAIASVSGPLAIDTGFAMGSNLGYWITQVITVTSAPSGTANAEWIAPIPVPAAGILLLGALGGLGLMRRRAA